MKKVLVILLTVMLFGTLPGCGEQKEQPKQSSAGSKESQAESQTEIQTENQVESQGENTGGMSAENSEGIPQESVALTGKHHVEITVKDYGTISVELDGDVAPISTGNFVQLASEGFYDGLTFHRIINGFMMQGGDPTGTGMGGSDTTIKGEFQLNGVDNTLSHTRGAISMARAKAYDSASSQFFIVHQDSTYLDGQYACFGYVTEGMDVVDEVCSNVPVVDKNGTVLAENQPVIESVKVID